MKKTYTKKQIIESIKHWKNVLKKMNESHNMLISSLFELFKTNDLLKPTSIKITDKILLACFNVINDNLFQSKLKEIPLLYESDNDIRKFLVSHKTKPNDIPKVFLEHIQLYLTMMLKL